MYRRYMALCIFWVSSSFGIAGDLPRVENVAPGVLIIGDDAGNWGGSSMGTTHQHQPKYQAMKIINLSALPPETLKRAKEARLRVFFAIQDYSWHDGSKPNGLDESFEVIVNGKVHLFRTNEGFIAKTRKEDPMHWAWQDFPFPVSELLPGENRFIIKKAEGPKYDDYIYVGIDNTVSHGNSMMSNDGGKTWTNKELNAIKATGEYMVRLVLIEKSLSARAVWRPDSGLEDPSNIVGYVGSEDADKSTIAFELDTRLLDRRAPLVATVECTAIPPGAAPPQVVWQDKDCKAMRTVMKKGEGTITSQPIFSSAQSPSRLVVEGAVGPQGQVRSVTIDATLAYLPEPVINICPKIAAPRGALVNQTPVCRIEGDVISLQNSTLKCQFVTANNRLRLCGLYNVYADAEMIRAPDSSPLFIVEIAERRYAGTRDFALRSVKPREDGKQGFCAELAFSTEGIALKADFDVSIDAEQLRWGMRLTNEGANPAHFKLAFPVLAGLGISANPAEDYYFFPMGGGIIADVPASVRKGYGDHAALYQVMDIFSPAHGAGLLVRTDDSDGRYKVLALKKIVSGKGSVPEVPPITPTTDEYKWKTSCLDSLSCAGVSMGYEYLRRTRETGKSFAPADAIIQAHPGDWHEAMRRYAVWAHKVWKFRPYPSRLDNVVNMIAAGWDGDMLFRDGKYRTDFIKPRCDCIELMSWWDWSPLGPWRTPIDKVKDVLGESAAKLWKPYFVKDPVTGQMMWNNQPGDYDGYNERFGGLPAFRKAIQTYKEMGALVTLYTDPFRMDDNSKVGSKYGKLWGVVKENGEYSKAYDVWNPCHDTPAVRQWVAETMKRVMRETGADGIRLDEYGHRGWACFSKLHPHTFAEPGCTEWQRAVAEATKMVRAAMDEINPNLVLTTEHPGYDYLMQYLDGCITYDLTGQASELRPLECNIQRFYFPECKPYELDHRGADKKHEKRFWNAVASFGAYYPLAMDTILRENNDAFHSRDCEPLVPTLAERVYANRFSGGGKVIWMLYNARGYTVDAPVLEVQKDAGHHYFDLLNCRELTLDAKSAVALKLPPNRTACVAQLPRVLTVRRGDNAILVSISERVGQGGDLKIIVATKDGDRVIEIKGKPGENRVELSSVGEKAAPPACVKLLREQYLVDAVPLP